MFADLLAIATKLEKNGIGTFNVTNYKSAMDGIEKVETFVSAAKAMAWKAMELRGDFAVIEPETPKKKPKKPA